jgi:tRNA(Ile)-lysidine synthase
VPSLNPKNNSAKNTQQLGARVDARLLRAIERGFPLAPGERVCVAVSGGADSVALLHLLLELRERLRIVLSVAHFNHKLRDKASEADELFVRKLAARFELPFHCDHADVAARAKRERANLEDTARRARYAFFAQLVAQGHATHVATAHTADDQAETVLAHVLRGTGLAGLGGIHPVAGHIIRPLLQCRRDELRAYLRLKKQRWREDATNCDTSRMRARIRKKLLPLLEKRFQPAVVQHLSSLADLAREDEQFLNALAAGFISEHATISAGAAKIAIADLLGPQRKNPSPQIGTENEPVPLALSKRIARQLIAAVKTRAGQITAAHTAEVLRFAAQAESGKTLQLPGGVEVRRQRDLLIFCAKTSSDETSTPQGPYSYIIGPDSRDLRVPVPEVNCAFRFTVIDWSAQRRETIGAGAILDCDCLRFPLELRSWQPTDALSSHSNSRARKLKRLLNDLHISRWEKQSWPVLTSGGVVAWARGFPIPAEFAPKERTRTVLVIKEEHS